MDSISQIALGAGVGEAVLGKKVGNKAILWGAVLGTIPDLDFVSAVFLDPMNYVFFHRGFSHSLVFFILSAPVFGWIIHKIHKKKEASWKAWSIFSFWVLFTHALLDSFTSWGTQLFWPLEYRVAWNSIFIVDPLYTVPLLASLIWLMFYKRDSSKRKWLNYAGLIISSCYLFFTVVNKQVINSVFEESLAEQGIEYDRFSTKNTPGQNILWFGTVQSESNYYIGYYSHLDDDKHIDFGLIEGNHELLNKYSDDENLQKLLSIMRGYYVVEESSDTLLLHDLRFGRATDFSGKKPEYIFTYFLNEVPVNGKKQLKITTSPRDPRDVPEGMFAALWQRIKGEKMASNF